MWLRLFNKTYFDHIVNLLCFSHLQLAVHCDTDCLKAPVACTFSTFGCREKVGCQKLQSLYRPSFLSRWILSDIVRKRKVFIL